MQYDMIRGTWYKVPLQDGVDLISRGRRQWKRGNTGVPMICPGVRLNTAFVAAVCFTCLV